MRKIAFSLMMCYAVICMQAQENFTRFHFTGLEVVIRQAEEFSYRLSDPKLCKVKTEQEWLVIETRKQTGKKTKGKVELWVRDIENLCVYNGRLLTPDTLYVEFLEIEMVASAGEAKVEAHFLQVNLEAEAQLTVSGTADLVSLNARERATLNAGELMAEEGEADVQSNARTTAFIRTVNRLFTSQGSFENLCE